MKKTVLAVVLFSVLCLLPTSLFVNRASANYYPAVDMPELPNIYVRSNGSIYPENASIQRLGDIYRFTCNIVNYSIVVQRDNIVVDGDGYMLQNGEWGNMGVVLTSVSNVTIRNMTIEGYHYGIVIDNSSHNSVIGNYIVNNSYAVSLASSSFNSITQNVVTSTYSYGINFGTSNNNTITQNSVTNNVNGIGIWNSSNNIIVENSITNNQLGMGLDSAANNRYYHNNFINNTQNLEINNHGQPSRYVNFGDNGTTGNYWNNYNGTDTNGDGIGDTPQQIPDQNGIINDQDNYPLMNPLDIPVQIPEFSAWTVLPMFLIATVFVVALKKRTQQKQLTITS